MSRNEAIIVVSRIGYFCARHSLAVIALAILTCILWTATYFALLLWAIFAGGGIGGPLAYPAGLIMFPMVSTFIGIFVFLPSTAFAEWFTHRHGWPILAQIPVCVAIIGIISIVIIIFAALSSSGASFLNSIMGFMALFLLLIIPLTVYWWVVQSIPLVNSLVQRIRMTFRSRARIQ